MSPCEYLMKSIVHSRDRAINFCRGNNQWWCKSDNCIAVQRPAEDEAGGEAVLDKMSSCFGRGKIHADQKPATANIGKVTMTNKRTELVNQLLAFFLRTL